MKKMLIAVDLKPITPEFIQHALLLAKPFQPEIELVHALPDDPEFTLYESDLQLLRDNLAEVYKVHHARVLELADTIRAEGYCVNPHVIQGDAVETILNHAQKADVDVIVIGAYGHGALYRTLLGSVSDGVLHKSKIPLYVIPLDD